MAAKQKTPSGARLKSRRLPYCDDEDLPLFAPIFKALPITQAEQTTEPLAPSGDWDEQQVEGYYEFFYRNARFEGGRLEGMAYGLAKAYAQGVVQRLSGRSGGTHDNPYVVVSSAGLAWFAGYEEAEDFDAT